ncbi:unnamed protein product, partial [Allacma fusca]
MHSFSVKNEHLRNPVYPLDKTIPNRSQAIITSPFDLVGFPEVSFGKPKACPIKYPVTVRKLGKILSIKVNLEELARSK